MYPKSTNIDLIDMNYLHGRHIAITTQIQFKAILSCAILPFALHSVTQIHEIKYSDEAMKITCDR